MNDLQNTEIELRLKGFSSKTIKSYLFHIQRFLESGKELREYVLWLAKRMDPRTINVAIAAIKFYFRNVLKQDVELSYLKRPKRLPEVLTKEETIAILYKITNTKHKLLIETIYGCGLRVSEAIELRKENLRFDEGLIAIRQSKGRKDRFVVLPKFLSARLKSYIEARADENPYVFDSNRGGHLTAKSVQLILQHAVQNANISKQVHVHTLRHSYATHPLEQGTDLRIIQRLLGHSSVRTTEIYAHVSNKLIKNVISPLDTLNSEKEISQNIRTCASSTKQTSQNL